jgi:hypothetical protein
LRSTHQNDSKYIKKTINFKKIYIFFFLWKMVPTSPCLTARNFEGNNRVHAKSQKKKTKKQKKREESMLLKTMVYRNTMASKL